MTVILYKSFLGAMASLSRAFDIVSSPETSSMLTHSLGSCSFLYLLITWNCVSICHQNTSQNKFAVSLMTTVLTHGCRVLCTLSHCYSWFQDRRPYSHWSWNPQLSFLWSEHIAQGVCILAPHPDLSHELSPRLGSWWVLGLQHLWWVELRCSLQSLGSLDGFLHNPVALRQRICMSVHCGVHLVFQVAGHFYQCGQDCVINSCSHFARSDPSSIMELWSWANWPLVRVVSQTSTDGVTKA